jgi:hypothetical protein
MRGTCEDSLHDDVSDPGVAASEECLPEESFTVLSNDWESVNRIREVLISDNLHRLGYTPESHAEPPPLLRRTRDERAAHRDLVRHACESNVRVTADSGEVTGSLSVEDVPTLSSNDACEGLPVSAPGVNTPVSVKPDPDCSGEGCLSQGK